MSKQVKKAVLAVAAVVLLALPVVEWVRFAYFTLRWPDVLLELSRLLAVMGFVVLFFQYVLSSRVRIFEATIGLDRLIVAHRQTGIAALLLLLLHGVFLTTYELSLGFLSLRWEKLLGIGALLLLLVVGGAALLWKSLGWQYETWKRIHYASYVILPVGFVHGLLLGSTMRGSDVLTIYFWVLLGIYVLLIASRVVKRLTVRANPYYVAAVERESHDTVSLYFDGPVPSFDPGQFMIVNLEKQQGGYSESHPYTISSAPEDDRLRLSAKAIGDFSSSVADVTPGSKALIEAPYGAFSYRTVPGQSLVFIAGGIGITPFLSQLRALRARGESRRVRLIWGNKTQEDIAFRDELQAAERELPDFSLVHVLSHEEWDGETGFVDAELIRKYVDDVETAEFFVCGPPVMMKMVIPLLGELGAPASRVHFERFALG